MTTNLSHDTGHAVIEDVQASADARRITIDKVGVKGIRHPVRLQGRDGMIQSTVATLAMYVRLPHDVKGTHMSRFLEILNAHHDAFTTESFEKVLAATAERLEATEAHIEMTFPYFIEKAAPVSGVRSLLDYEVTLIGEVRNGVAKVTSKVLVPVTSLCPCSKAISDYGAHNQRSHVTLSVRSSTPIPTEELVELVEAEASCELYGVLKRADEKFVTERAYENPKFVEDMVRDVAARLNEDDRVRAYCVESENFESIHNHSAYALVEHDKDLD